VNPELFASSVAEIFLKLKASKEPKPIKTRVIRDVVPVLASVEVEATAMIILTCSPP
jgi:hypothetical protein